MSTNKRAVHAVRGFSLPIRQVRKAMENHGSFVWVVEGETFRDATLAEMREARARQAFLREPLPLSEIHGLRYEPPTGAVAAFREGQRLAYAATQLANAGGWEATA